VKIKTNFQRRFIFILILGYQLHGFSQLNFTLTSLTGGYTLNCIKTSLTLSITANTNNSLQCTWNSLLNGTLTGNPIIINNPDSYTVTVQDLVTIETKTQALSISQDTIAPSASGGTGTIICSPNWEMTAITLEPAFLSSSVNCTFTWQATNSLGFLTAQNESSVVVAMAGTYTCVITNTVNGCSTSVLFYVSCYVGVNEISMSENEIVISPNPFKDKINIEVKGTTHYKIQIIDDIGRLIYEKTYFNSKQEVALSIFPVGIYFLKAEAEGINKVFKIIKE